MVVLGAFFWSYALLPPLPVIRSLHYIWRGNLLPAVEWRVVSAIAGTAWIAVAVLVGPPLFPYAHPASPHRRVQWSSMQQHECEHDSCCSQKQAIKKTNQKC
jgi:hypothetical protein